MHQACQSTPVHTEYRNGEINIIVVQKESCTCLHNLDNQLTSKNPYIVDIVSYANSFVTSTACSPHFKEQLTTEEHQDVHTILRLPW